MIDELYLYSYANEPNKSPWRERLGALLPLRETATFPPQADHVLVVFFFGHGGTWGPALKPPDPKLPAKIKMLNNVSTTFALMSNYFSLDVYI